MDVIETGPRGTTLRETVTTPRATRQARAFQALREQALAGKLTPVQAARAGRLLSWAPDRFRRFRLCLNATPVVFGYAFRNVPPDLQPVTLAGRITYAGALAGMACRKIWRRDLAFMDLPRPGTLDPTKSLSEQGAL